jgi:hypothetical protein
MKGGPGSDGVKRDWWEVAAEIGDVTEKVENKSIDYEHDFSHLPYPP